MTYYAVDRDGRIVAQCRSLRILLALQQRDERITAIYDRKGRKR